ncbi:hypothetical protein SDC9_162008 [bioreactor metagenome]|uniref:Uncharacterized protein n=1 Tax=bioreactor metagenome TaxID=1076179 RepID=A0A645FJX6_9ZZZZ
MGRIHGKHIIFGKNEPAFEFVQIIPERTQNSNVDFSRPQGVQLSFRFHFVQPEFHFRIRFSETEKSFRQEGVQRRFIVAYGKRAAPAGGELFHSFNRVGGPFQNRFRLLQKKASGVRESDYTAGALEQLYSEFILQPGDLLAQRRLRDIQTFRRFPEMKLVRYCDKIFEVRQFH